MEQAKGWARKLLSDPSLVVRTSAVKVIRESNDRASESHLWQELYHKINYRGAQSLWIRRHIVETLSDFSTQGSEGQFVSLLDDPDRSLHAPAMKALEKLTGQTSQSRKFWKAWAQHRSL